MGDGGWVGGVMVGGGCEMIVDRGTVAQLRGMVCVGFA